MLVHHLITPPTSHLFVVQSSNRTVYPTTCPSSLPASAATRLATVTAATLRGCVHAITPPFETPPLPFLPLPPFLAPPLFIVAIAGSEAGIPLAIALRDGVIVNSEKGGDGLPKIDERGGRSDLIPLSSEVASYSIVIVGNGAGERHIPRSLRSKGLMKGRIHLDGHGTGEESI